jgi:DNA polymerase (family X)
MIYQKVRKADVTRAIAAARGILQPRSLPPLSADDAVAELSRLPGLGAARARLLYDELGVCTLQELGAALAEGRVTRVRGFGTGVAGRLEEALGRLLDPTVSVPLPDAEVHVQRLLAWMRQAPTVQGVEVAGSVRRRCDVVSGISILAVTSRAPSVMRHFLSYGDAATSTAVDPSRGAMTLHCGLPVELHIVPGRCHGAALHHLTGSASYEAAVRALGLERGVRVSDYGVFLLDPGRAGARRVGGQKEEDIFTALGMDWIPPELRENDGEIEAALLHALPRLVRMEDIHGDLRLRTRSSGGSATVEEMARSCRGARYAFCAMVDPFGAGVPGGLCEDRLRLQAEAVRALAGRAAMPRVLHGIEVAISPEGVLEMPDAPDLLPDLVVGVIHTRARMSRARATHRLLRAIQDPRLHVLGWPTGRIIGEREPMDADYDEVFRAAAEAGVAVELSAEPRRLDPPRDLVRSAARTGALVAIGSGAGEASELGRIRFGVDLARRGWLEPRQVLNSWAADELQEWLRSRRAP